MEMSFGNRSQFSATVLRELSRYRYKVFVDHLGWELPGEPGQENDQFDRDDTEYVVARDEAGRICGCARLLPTSRPYLLEEVFPMLMYGQPVPKDPDIWEVSRFTVWDPAQEGRFVQDSPDGLERMRELTRAVHRRALELGAQRLIMVSSYGIERLLRRIGYAAHRTGAPMMWDGQLILACWIEVGLSGPVCTTANA